jgi:hypothetical protein
MGWNASFNELTHCIRPQSFRVSTEYCALRFARSVRSHIRSGTFYMPSARYWVRRAKRPPFLFPSNPKIIEELSCWLDACNKQMVTCARAGDVEEMTLGVIDFLQICIIAHRFDSLLQRDDLIVASHDDDALLTLRRFA